MSYARMGFGVEPPQIDSKFKLHGQPSPISREGMLQRFIFGKCCEPSMDCADRLLSRAMMADRFDVFTKIFSGNPPPDAFYGWNTGIFMNPSGFSYYMDVGPTLIEAVQQVVKSLGYDTRQLGETTYEKFKQANEAIKCLVVMLIRVRVLLKGDPYLKSLAEKYVAYEEPSASNVEKIVNNLWTMTFFSLYSKIRKASYSWYTPKPNFEGFTINQKFFIPPSLIKKKTPPSGPPSRDGGVVGDRRR